MAKIKNRILIILALVMLCAVGLFALSACSNTETYTVTFMVRENGICSWSPSPPPSVST